MTGGMGASSSGGQFRRRLRPRTRTRTQSRPAAPAPAVQRRARFWSAMPRRWRSACLTELVREGAGLGAGELESLVDVAVGHHRLLGQKASASARPRAPVVHELRRRCEPDVPRSLDNPRAPASSPRELRLTGSTGELDPEARAVGPLDPSRLLAIGVSSGGYMTSRMAVSYPGKFRALAIAAGASCRAARD